MCKRSHRCFGNASGRKAAFCSLLPGVALSGWTEFFSKPLREAGRPHTAFASRQGSRELGRGEGRTHWKRAADEPKETGRQRMMGESRGVYTGRKTESSEPA